MNDTQLHDLFEQHASFTHMLRWSSGDPGKSTLAYFKSVPQLVCGPNYKAAGPMQKGRGIPMNPSKVILILSLAFSACSDMGSEPWAGWTEYNLPYSQIYLPPELSPQRTAPAPYGNPEFAGTVNSQYIVVQFCIYNTFPTEFLLRGYQEEMVSLGGKPAVLFQGLGALHVYDSHFSSLVGLKAYFRPDTSAVVVVTAIRSPEAYSLARNILMSMHPEPRNTGMPL